MSPEMLSSQVGPEADVWAAGVMAYQLLCGNFPFNDWKVRGSAHIRLEGLYTDWKAFSSLMGEG